MYDPEKFSFHITKQSKTSAARLGRLHTPHGVVETPAFIFCATKAAIKGATPKQMRDAGTQIILSNTYHLMLQPGGELVEKMGGLHKFMGWDGPMLTDSGGYQIFSLGHGSVSEEIKGKRNGPKNRSLKRICEEGATFKSYMGGKMYTLTPESSIQIQRQLGADLIVVLDECTPFHVDKSYTERSMHMSHRWALRSLAEFNHLNEDGRQALYGIIQGGVYQDLREAGTDFVNSQPFFGHAVGGSLGASKDQMEDIVSYTMSRLSRDRPVHLLGIGGIRDIFHGVEQGIDTFDCVHPTRLARHGGALVRAKHWREQPYKGSDHLNMRNAIFKDDPRPIDADCSCEICAHYSRAYIHHLFKANELLGLSALTIHNVAFMNDLLQAIRKAIAEDRLTQERENWLVSESEVKEL
ncbi:MAG: tRNA guanosine(34) transglycosylase Tgt [Alphaproteobacteria bacterium]|nr:tRNA guanosine(34) transglycosylase Tgt [Alphaproteobacteria bacterium]